MKLDTLITNARIETLDTSRPAARAMGVLHGRIVGFDSDVSDLPARRVVDAAGSVVVPGFNDAHCHTAWFGLGLNDLNMEGVATISEVMSRLAAGAAALAPDAWVLGTGYPSADFGGRFPDIDDLDRISGGRPLVLRSYSGHSLVANSRALELGGVLRAGFTASTGGVVHRDEHGSPTGVLEEKAQNLVLDLVRPYPRETLVDALDRATAVYAQEGITSFTEAGIGAGMIGHSPVELAAYQQALESGRLRARAQVMPTFDSLSALHANDSDGIGVGLALGARSGFGNDRLSLGPVKMFFDGGITGETAALTAPYSHKHIHGYLTDDPAQLVALAGSAGASGWSLAIHAIGDAAVDAALDAIDAARARRPVTALPDRIEHAALVRPDQLDRIRRAGVAVAPQAAFFPSTGDVMLRNIGPDRARYFYRAQSFLDAGVVMAGSSDRPCTNLTALQCIESYVTRATGSGAVSGPDAEKLSGESALRTYTQGSAAATGRADRVGTLAEGMLADFVLLSDSPSTVEPHAISSIEVRATAVGGDFTFDKGF
jgi:predicted amidohydrolase YtcJ